MKAFKGSAIAGVAGLVSLVLLMSAPASAQSRPDPGDVAPASPTPNPVGAHPRTDFTSTITAPATLDTGDTVTVTGNNIALHALDAGNAIVVLGGGGITATNLSIVGYGVVDAAANGAIDLGTGTNVVARGFGPTPGFIGATGISSTTGAVISAKDVTVSATSDAPYGIYANDGGTIVLTGLTTIATASNGGEGSGLITSRPGSTLAADDVIVTMDGVNGVYGQYENPISAWRGSKLTITGDASYDGIGQEIEGLAAFYADSVLTLNNVTGTATGTVDYATGATATDGGIVTINGNADLTAIGAARAFGLQVIGGGTISLLGSSSILHVTAPESYGLYTEDGGTITLDNGAVSARGNTATAIYSVATAAATESTINVAASTLTSDGDGLVVLGGTANVNFDHVALSNDSGHAISVGDNGGVAGTLNFIASGSTLTGAATTASGSTSNVTLRSASLWTVTGNSNLSSLVNDASTVSFSAPTGHPTVLAGYKTLTVEDYAGVNGIIGLNTFLGTDGSPSDLLVVDGGAATGTTGLKITNSGGPGEATTGDGILVVSAINGAATAEDAFHLANAVREGAFDYGLAKGPLVGNGGTNAESWFLRSEFVVEPEDPTEPIEPGIPDEPGGPGNPDEVLPVDPPPDELPPDTSWPDIGPEMATYDVVQPLARIIGMASLGTLHDRTGDTILMMNGSSSDTYRPPVWGRAFGRWVKDRYRSFADPEVAGNMVGLQVGADLLRRGDSDGNRDLAGLYVSLAQGDFDVTGLVANLDRVDYEHVHTGTVDLTATSFGAYWTHYGPGDWYIDAVMQATRYGGSADTAFLSLPTNGYGLLVSLEGGYPIDLPAAGPGFRLEPQTQIVWQGTRFDTANDGAGDVSLGTTSGVSGRIGLRASWKLKTEGGTEWRPYLRANLWHDWGGKVETTYGAHDQVPLLESANRIQLGGGLSVKLNDSLDFNANADYEFAVGNSDGGERSGFRAALGLRGTW